MIKKIYIFLLILKLLKNEKESVVVSFRLIRHGARLPEEIPLKQWYTNLGYTKSKQLTKLGENQLKELGRRFAKEDFSYLGIEYQHKLILQMLTDQKFANSIIDIIDPNYFQETPLKTIITTIKRKKLK